MEWTDRFLPSFSVRYFCENPIALNSDILDIPSANISCIVVLHVACPGVSPVERCHCIGFIGAVCLFDRPPSLWSWNVSPCSNIAFIVILHVNKMVGPFFGCNKQTAIVSLMEFKPSLLTWITGLSSHIAFVIVLDICIPIWPFYRRN